ncbi:MAG: beta-galactosidase [Nocardiopsaceae bacterium]|nr:beta-galactosidase [Nocardiopsaceae bacterium]
MTDETLPQSASPVAALARRQFLRATAVGAAGLAAWSVTSSARGATVGTAARGRGPAAQIVPFGTGWLFGPATTGSDQPGFDDSGLQSVTLPHTVTALSWQEWDPSTWEKEWVYRKTFDAPASASTMRVFVDFAAAMTQSSLTLNGHAVGGRTGGYLPFSAEITDYLKPQGNVLAVTLDSRFNIDVPPDRPAPQASDSVDFWQPGGIYREAWLRAVPQVFLADVFAKPVNVLDAAKRQVDVSVTIDAAVVPKGAAQVDITLNDGARVVSSTSVPVTISATGQTTVTGTLTGGGLSGVTLWDIDNPKLYTVTATLRLGGAPVHDYVVRTGFRDAVFQLDGFYLNGRKVKLFGVNRHQFFPFAGGAMPARVQRKDAAILRDELNCVMVRCSHYPQSEDFYDACDEVGLLAWEEIPGWGYMGDSAWQSAAYRDVGDMVVRDRNHPSIIVWGAMPNESRENVSLYTATNKLAHSLDDSRATGGDDFDRTDTAYEFDVFSFHDYSSQTGPDGKKEPTLQPPTDAAGKPYLVCEAVGTLSGPSIYYRRIDTQDVQQGQATAHARVHDIAYSDDRYCGLLAWSGYDYPSGAGANLYNGVKYTGVVDLFRIPKPGAAIYQAQVDPKVRPVIQPAFYWDFGSTSPVTSLSSAMICSNADRLEVYVGGSHYATVTPDTADYGHLPYPPSFVDFSSVDSSGLPELRIDGYLGSAMVLSRSFSSDPSADSLTLAADDAQLFADGADATRVVFRAVDKYGAPRPYVSGQVQLSITGPATLIGENPFDFAATGGAGAVWIRTRSGQTGTVVVQASHPTLGSAAAPITVVAPALGAPEQNYATWFGQVPSAPAAAVTAPARVNPLAGHGG